MKARVIVVGGGVRSGKSSFAVALAHELGDRRAFVATAKPLDDEMRERIDRHRRDRQDAFDTFEEPLALADQLSRLRDYDVVVVDCVTLWLSNQLLRRSPSTEGAVRAETLDAVLEDVDGLVRVLGQRRFHAILVTNEVGMSVHPPTSLGRAFVELSGFAHQRLARVADEIYLAVLGTVIRLPLASDPTLTPTSRGDHG
jgi:adenosylcobinamide kinase/adenosylcobinamide-phosphate guanylyltransferase